MHLVALARRTIRKRAVQVLRDGAAHVGDFNAVIVEAFEEMRRELRPPAR